MVVFGQMGCIETKVVVFGKVVVSGNSGFIRTIVVVFGQSGCTRAKVVVFGQKWFYSRKSGFIQTKLLYSNKRTFIRVKWVLFVQMWLYSCNLLSLGKSACIWQSGCIR